MSLLDDAKKHLQKFLQGLSPKQREDLKLRSCRACSFCQEEGGKLWCKQVQPKARILNEFEAHICIYYSPETVTTGLLSKAQRELFSSFIEKIKSIENVDLVSVIELINVIAEITTIKTIETINNMPDPTPKGTEGVAFKQASAGTGQWVSPTDFEDPSGQWSYEENAYDEDIGTGAVITPPAEDWTDFLILEHSAIMSNKLRIYISFVTIQFDQIDIDVYKDGSWVHVYEGFAQMGWTEYSFSEGSVTKVRIRVHGKTSPDVDQSVKEFDFWEVPSTGGELIIVQVDPSKLKMSLFGGTTVYEETQEKAMTTNDDDVVLTVPSGKEWLVYYGYLTNNSNASIDMSVSIRDSNNVGMGYLFTRTSLANGTLISLPHREGTERIAELGHGAYPVRLVEGQKIQMRWGANAGKSGTSYWFLMIKQFDL